MQGHYSEGESSLVCLYLDIHSPGPGVDIVGGVPGWLHNSTSTNVIPKAGGARQLLVSELNSYRSIKWHTILRLIMNWPSRSPDMNSIGDVRSMWNGRQ